MDSLDLEKPCSLLKDAYSSNLETYSSRQVFTLHLDTPSVRDNGDPAQSPVNCVCQRLEEYMELLELSCAASAGGQNCQILLEGILHFLPVLPEAANHKLAGFFVQRRGKSRYVKIICNHSLPIHLEFFTTEDKHSGCNAIAKARLVSDPGSAEFFNTVRRWIDECNRKHTPCARAFLSSRHHVTVLPRLSNRQFMSLFYEKPPLLARILDVGGKIKLEHKAKCENYLTLISRWPEIGFRNQVSGVESR